MVGVQEQLGLEGMPAELVRVTPAKLATWQRCPRKYRMAYLDRPAPPRSGARADATLGAVVHNALRAYFAAARSARTPQRAAELVREHWKSDGFAHAEQASRYRRRAQDWVRDYVSELDPDTAPVAVERHISAPIGSIIAEGRVDRIDERDGELVVVDYKTGRRTPDEQDAGRSQALALYALGIRQRMRRPCRRVELHHLPTNTTAVWEHTERTLQQAREQAQRSAEEFRSAAEQLAAGGDGAELFPVRTGDQCSRCEFRAHCSAGRRAAPDVSPWASLRE